ncbi:MAG: hypothetical protein B7Z55_04245, partial [Planctomycetales bacterium 12-60-4]
KCPTCDTKVRVPAGADKPQKKKRAEEPADSEDALATLDLRNVEDHEARICGKCGYDMQHMDEEETECPKCGYDSSMGGLGEKAQKKRLKGPDPDKFYSGLWKPNWKFVFKNQGLAWRTTVYVLIASVLMFFCAFMYLWVSQWPPRIFFAMCGFVAAMMIPGWLWFLDEQIIVNTLQKKDKLKRINFDFFLCSALGVKFLAWNIVFALPIVLIPAIVSYVMSTMGGLPVYLAAIPAVIGYLPVLAMMPICLGHFVMPVQAPGWQFWKVFPAWLRTLKPTLIWLFLAIGLNLPVIGCLATAGALYGPQINTIVLQMEENGAITRAKSAMERAGKADKQKFAGNPLLEKAEHTVDFSPLIVPGVLWGLSCLFLGFPAVYCSRLNGQFVYFFRDSLDLIALAKEYKYVAKEVKDEDEEEKPKTTSQILVESIVLTFICLLLGAIGGLLYGAFNDDIGYGLGLVIGAYYGAWFATVIGRINLLNAAFKESTGWGFIVLLLPFGDVAFVVKHWQEGAAGCLLSVFGSLMCLFVVILAFAGLVSLAALGLGDEGDGQQPPPDLNAPAGEGVPAAEPIPPAVNARPIPHHQLMARWGTPMHGWSEFALDQQAV